MRMKLRTLAAFAAIALLGCGCTPGTSATADAARAVSAKTVPLSIKAAGGLQHFRVEVARTPQEQARGLMYRTSLPDHGGMIFPMKPPRFASFWMKNTLIPLDIIFIRADGTIERVAANAVPEDLTPIESGEPVAAVLELAGGEAARLGIAEGNLVRW